MFIGPKVKYFKLLSIANAPFQMSNAYGSAPICQGLLMLNEEPGAISDQNWIIQKHTHPTYLET